MQFFKSILVGAAALVSLVAAQEGGNTLRFTAWETALKAGVPTTFTWEAPSDAPVTITLREGPSGNLRDILTVTSDATGGSYTWTPPADELFNSGNYAFEISQEGSEDNYTGQFAIGDANGASPAPEASTASETPAPTSAETSSAEPTAESTTESAAETTDAPTTMATAVSETSTHASTHSTNTIAPTESSAPVQSAPPGNSAASFKSSVALVLAAAGAFALFQ